MEMTASFEQVIYRSGKILLVNLVQCVVLFAIIYALNKITSFSINVFDVVENFQHMMNVASKLWDALPYILLAAFVLGFLP